MTKGKLSNHCTVRTKLQFDLSSAELKNINLYNKLAGSIQSYGIIVRLM